MAHGHEDWGAFAQVSTIYTVQDMGELAARMGSLALFDRRGNLCLSDDFESTTLKWGSDTLGANSARARSTTSAFMGDASMALTAGPDIDDYAKIYNSVGWIKAGKLGLEFVYNLPDNNVMLELHLRIHTGSTQLNAKVRYDSYNYLLQYFDQSSTWQTFATAVHVEPETYRYYAIKFVADMVNKVYTRCIFNGIEYDLSAYSIQETAGATAPLLEVFISHHRLLDTTETVYIDNVLLTQNEP